MKFTTDRPFADPEKAARRLMQHAPAFEPVEDGRIYIEKINAPILFGNKGTPANMRRASTARLPSAGSNCTKAEIRAVHRKRLGPVCLMSPAFSVELRTAGLDVLSRITKPQ